MAGLVITISTMMRSFAETPPSPDPVLSSSIGNALTATAIGIAIGIVGVILVCIAVVACRFTPPWLLRALVVASLLWLIIFPVGTIAAAIALVVLARNRHIFAPPTRQ